MSGLELRRNITDARWKTYRARRRLHGIKRAIMAALCGWTAAFGQVQIRAADAGSALLLAAEKGDLNAATQLLAKGAAVNVRNPTNGWTPLIFAAKRGDLAMATLLISNKADVNAQSTTAIGSRALMFAIDDKNLKLIDLLLAHGARINDPARNGETALHHAATLGHLAATKLLLSKGADPNQYTFRNENRFVFTPFLGAFFRGDTNMASLLLEHGADIETRNNRGNTALMQAAMFETPEALQWLIAKGANVNARGHHGHSALIYAAYNGRVENVRALLRAGADPFAKASNAEEPDTSFEYDAANEARAEGHGEILAMILEAQKRFQPKPTSSR